MLEANRQQAMLPNKAEYLQNTTGTAPGMWFNHPAGGVVVSLPGVPYEMKYLMTTHVLPRIKSRFTLPIIEHLYLRTIGIGESFIAHKIAEWEASLPAHIRLAYLPSVYQVKLRLTARGNDREALRRAIESKAAEVIPMLGHYLYAEENIDIQECVASLLVEKGLSITTAESCTGGALAALITSMPGSSRYYMGSTIAYSNWVKIKQLGVSEQTLATYGAVSEATVREMALGALHEFKTDLAIATSGIAGPDGGTPDKPVGTVWLALAHGDTVHTRLLQLAGSRENNIRASVLAALDLVRLSLTGKLVAKG
jgi:nicotinamide-nucleotide amidase